MHEGLYLKDSKVLKNILLILGLLILPFSLLSFGTKDGAFFCKLQFDFAILLASVTISSARFLPIGEKNKWICLPYFTLLGFLFCRFGTVTLFSREIPFQDYLPSVILMVSAFGYSFILHFITEEKMRTKAFLITWGILMEVIALVSAVFQIVPFAVYDDITKGTLYFGIGKLISFVLINAAPLILAFYFKNDKINKKKN